MPFVLLWALMWASLRWSYWLTLLIALPAAGFLVRLFMIQHDCGHGAFFRNRRANDWVGRVLGVVTLTPYDHWRESHAVHHATSGNLDHRGIGDIDTLTVREYLAFALGSPSLPSLPQSRRHVRYWARISFPAQEQASPGRAPGWLAGMAKHGHQCEHGAVVVALIWLVGVGPFVLVHLPIMLLAASIGVWLFYVQHQFEDTFWARKQAWTLHEAALHGSSHYDLPPILRWMTANIGMHHVHHLSSRIPFYRLPQVLRDHPELQEAKRLTLVQSFACVRLPFGMKRQRLISFRHLHSSE